MKHQARTAMAIAVIAGGWGTAPLARAQNAWIVYENVDFHFTIDVPAPPQLTLGTTPGPAGPLPTLQGAIEMSPDASLELSAIDLSTVKAGIDPNAILEGGIKGVVNAATATIDSETTINDGAAIGRDVIFHNANSKYEMRTLFLNRRGVVVIGLGEGKVPVEFARAAASLKLRP